MSGIARIQVLILDHYKTELPGLYQCKEDQLVPPSLSSQEEAMAQVTNTEKSLVHSSGISHQCYCPPPPSLHYLTFK